MSCLLWFRRDLRLDDNPALLGALASGQPILPVYVHAPDEEAPWAPGAASRWWLHHSLQSLDESLRRLGSRLWIARGDSLETLRRIAQEAKATEIHWNRRYEPLPRERDTRIKQALRSDGLRCVSHKAALLFEPWEILTGESRPYRVFTAFWRKSMCGLSAIRAAPSPTALTALREFPGNLAIENLDLLPKHPWDAGLRAAWIPGETAALARAATFIEEGLTDYPQARDRPGTPGTSGLSPHLHFGEISPRRLVTMIMARHVDPTRDPAESFLRELAWREFAYHILYHFPRTPTEPLDSRFADLPWKTEGADGALRAWQEGRTGIPLVDAGMRELWHSGWMHNRIRMVAASLLTKNMRLPWQAGARWFWDTLVDADLASNTFGWQWTAGCGADAAPYFRIFNPVRQGERFDPEAIYIRRWCPELARLPNRFIHQPWAAPQSLRSEAGVRLGCNYPEPLVDLATSRLEALAGWNDIKRHPRDDQQGTIG